jgi:hypothetical protein
METLTVTKPRASLDINAVCVDAIDHGLVDTPWGVKPRLELVFETGENTVSGLPKFLSRTFNFFAYANAALTLEMKNWLWLDIEAQDEWDPTVAVGKPATLRASETVSANGKMYWKIDAINPAGAVHVEPSGNYRRIERN